MSGSITKQAFGRHGFIGSLYDVRTDRFEGGNLFNQDLPEGLVLTKDCAVSDFFVDEHLSQKETFNKLNVEASMKLSLMAGLITVEGSAKYLKQTKTNSRTVRVTFMFNVRTKEQYLQVSRADLHQYFSSDALENPNATHCIVGIKWGARVAATFEETLSSFAAAEELQGCLAASLKKATINISGEAKLENVDKVNSDFHSLKISFSGDVLIEDVPNTISDVFNIFKKVPKMIEKLNEGKGQQLEFELYPLKRMAEIFKHELRIQRISQDVANLTINRVENVFEQLIEVKRLMNDYLAKIEPWQDWISFDWIEVIAEKQAALVGEEMKTQRQIATLLEQIRRGEVEEKSILDLVEHFNEQNPCSVLSIKRFLKENARIDTKIISLSHFDQSSPGKTDQEKRPNAELLPRKCEFIEDFSLNSYNKDVFLLNISNEWEKNDKTNWHKQLRFFNQLQKMAESLPPIKKPIFVVIDHDLHNLLEKKPDRCVIYHAFQGLIQSEDYYYTSMTTLSQDQLQKIRIQTGIDIYRRDLEEKYREFLRRQ